MRAEAFYWLLVVKSQAFFTLRRDNKVNTINLDELNASLEGGHFDLIFGTKKINLLDIAPDLYVASYTGSRYGLKDFLLSVSQFLQYKLTGQDVLGEGSFATVRKAIFRGTDYNQGLDIENVAIKLLKMDNTSERASNVALREFIQEIEIQGPLKHPNIVEVLGTQSFVYLPHSLRNYPSTTVHYYRNMRVQFSLQTHQWLETSYSVGF